VTAERGKTGESAPSRRTALLSGADAVELYVAEIDRNLEAIDAQVALLRAAFIERKRLLRDICSVQDKPEDEIPGARQESTGPG
jgi:hypothetical protein